MFLQDYAKFGYTSTFFCTIMQKDAAYYLDRAERISNRRVRQGYKTQDDLAREAGVAKRTISSLESPTEKKDGFQTEKLRRVAKALGWTVEFMMTGKTAYGEHKPENLRLDDGAEDMVRSTLTTLRSQAASMIQQIDLLQKQIAGPEANSTVEQLKAELAEQMRASTAPRNPKQSGVPEVVASRTSEPKPNSR